MDTSKLKTFAQEARKTLRDQVQAKINLVLAEGSSARREAGAAVAKLEAHIAGSSREQVIESVAYTWFNRFCALRYMDARGYTRVRIVSPPDGFTQPEILAEAKTGQFNDELTPEPVQKRVSDLLSGTVPSPNPQGEAYRILLVAACNSYRRLLPSVFEYIADEIELLMPDDLLASGSVLSRFVETLTEEDCVDVEILGWLYQFYISERKDQVMARKSAVPTEDIPAVTQLFTPHWIVRYLVENSLGRLWLLNRPGSRLREHMPYYIEGEKNASGGSPDDFLKITKPEEIRLCDPAVGSGHMLTYAFDLLTLIYEEEGYAPTEIPALILRHNLHGLEICPRAAQLAELALVFKAREKSRRFFQPEHLVRPRIIELRDVRFAENELRDYIRALGLGDLFNQPMLRLLHQFEEAKNFGSLIQPCLDERAIAFARRAIEAKDLGGQLFLRETHLKVLRVLEQAEALTQRYHVVVANPPYMGVGAMTGPVKTFAKSWFPRSKTDFFAMFIERAISLCVSNGFAALVTMHGWMFLSTFEELRRALIASVHLKSLLHIGPRGFDSISGEVVQTAAFVLENKQSAGRTGTFIRLVEGSSEEGKVKLLEDALETRDKRLVFAVTGRQFDIIPGSPIAYWVSEAFRRCFDGSRSLGDRALFRQGMSTTDAGRFEREWHEIDCVKLNLKRIKPIVEKDPPAYWYPFNKGGSKRRWYGNLETVVRYERNGQDLLDLVTRKYPKISDPEFVIKNRKYFFLPAITYASIGTGSFVSRSVPAGCTYSVAGPAIFPDGWDSRCLLALLCSTTTTKFLEAINPTLGFQITDVGKIPISDALKQLVEVDASNLAEQAISVARADWDNFETSWDFRDQPLLRPGLKGATLEASWRNWEAQSTAAIRRMQELETENNRLFIAAYGLDGELQPEVPEAQITLARAEARRDMAAFLSYAVGCMMGRYSPDHPGLILANAGDTVEDYRRIIGEKREASGENRDKLSFEPDEDNVIPILDGDWFPDDITERFKKFLKLTFGEQHFDENIRFLEESLGKDVRKYFLTDFYKNHVQTYKKRPIYWLFSSPKGTFNALIYMHRYRPDTMSVVLKYLRDFQTKLQSHKTHLESIANSADAKKADKTKALKQITQLTKDLKELADYERKVIYPLASERREIDLDNGVKHNYPLFGEALKKIAGLDAKEDE